MEIFGSLRSGRTKSPRAEHDEAVRKIRKELLEQPTRPEYLATRRPVLDDLRRVGCDVPTLEHLKADIKLWKAAVPVLIEWLDRLEGDGPDNLKEEIARLLAAKFAKGAEPALIRTFIAAQNPGLKWAAGNSLFVLASSKFAGELLAIARDRQHGTTRQMVVYGLWKLKSQQAYEAAVDCLDDEGVRLHAIYALGRMKNPKAIPLLEPLLNSERAGVRRETKKALERLRKITAP